MLSIFCLAPLKSFDMLALYKFDYYYYYYYYYRFVHISLVSLQIPDAVCISVSADVVQITAC